MATRAQKVQWRLNDPGEESAQRWTKVHRVSLQADDLTMCHMRIPEHPYMMDFDEDVDPDAPVCKRCQSPDHREA